MRGNAGTEERTLQGVPRQASEANTGLPCQEAVPHGGGRIPLLSLRWQKKPLPCPSFPWCFCLLGVFLPGNFRGVFVYFLLILEGFKGLLVRIILDAFEVFLGAFEKNREKKVRVFS